MDPSADAVQLDRAEQILAQLDKAPATKVSNNRHAARQKIRIPIAGLVLACTGEFSLKIFSRDISTSGIGFVCRRQCKPDEHIVLSLNLPEARQRLILARIVFCSYAGAGLYQAGAEFIESVTVTGKALDIPPHWKRN